MPHLPLVLLVGLLKELLKVYFVLGGGGGPKKDREFCVCCVVEATFDRLSTKCLEISH